MGPAQWWADKLQEALSQGDIVADLPVFIPTCPTRYLQKRTFKGNVTGWVESRLPVLDGDRKANFLATGRVGPVLILSHSCELDKDTKSGRVIVAFMAPISSVAEDIREVILKQEHLALMPLPDVPELGTHYADLRTTSTRHREVVNSGRRIASITDMANERLAAQIVGFFLRRELPGGRG